MTCEVCKRDGATVGVFASQVAPMSFRKCEECIDNWAEPLNTMLLTQKLNPEQENLLRCTFFEDGEYKKFIDNE